jgi:hypothetical protein
MLIPQNEIFGPVMTVIPYSGEDRDAVRIANDSVYGLGDGVAAASTSRAFNVSLEVSKPAGVRLGERGVATPYAFMCPARTWRAAP